MTKPYLTLGSETQIVYLVAMATRSKSGCNRKKWHHPENDAETSEDSEKYMVVMGL